MTNDFPYATEPNVNGNNGAHLSECALERES